MILRRFLKYCATKGIPYVAILVIGIAMVAFEHDVLLRVEEQSLFLHTPLFFKQCMVASGGLLSWTGAFLTQFFYYPALGVAILCLLWCLLVWMARRAFRIPDAWVAVTLIPVAMLLITDVDLGYWIYYLKLRGHFFVATLGVIVVVGLVWVYRVLPQYVRSIWIVVTVVVGYPLFGFYALLAALLMAVMAWRVGQRPVAASIDTLLAIVAIAAVPLLCYRTIYHETHLSNIWWTALPVFHIRQENYPNYNIPYIVLVLSLLAMAISYRRQPSSETPRKWERWANWGVVAIMALAIVLGWYKGGNFHREIAMRRCVDRLDWEGVLSIARNTTAEPTRDMWMMKNLALARLGRQGDEMYDYPNGAAPADAPFPTRMVQWDGKMIYLNYGLPNFCYRWCMEDGVEYGWKVDHLKLMLKCSLLNGEFDAAQKYISMLKKTLFHKKWAKRYEDYIHNSRHIVEDEELLPIVHMLSRENYLSSDYSVVERFLIEHLAGTESQDPLLQEQALLAAMQTRNPNLFWLRFYQYTELHKSVQVPLLYQQAACMFGGMDDKVDASKMPFDQKVVDGCKAFMEALKQYRDQGMDMEQIKPLMKTRFENTYYYDYFFNKYQEEVY